MKKFDLFSDIHADNHNLLVKINGEDHFFPWDQHQQSDTLVIPGDLSNYPEYSIAVAISARTFYDRVLFIDGNHDNYNIGKKPDNTDVFQRRDYFRDMSRTRPGIHYLSTDPVVIDRVGFIGQNAWYDFRATHAHQMYQKREWKRGMNDAKCVLFGGKEPEELARDQAELLLRDLDQIGPKVDEVVVVTHTVPHNQLLVPPGHPWYHLNGSYHNSIVMGLLRTSLHWEKISTWCFGHTHFPHDRMLGDIRFCCNPRGYPHEGGRGKIVAPITIEL